MADDVPFTVQDTLTYNEGEALHEAFIAYLNIPTIIKAFQNDNRVECVGVKVSAFSIPLRNVRREIGLAWVNYNGATKTRVGRKVGIFYKTSGVYREKLRQKLVVMGGQPHDEVFPMNQVLLMSDEGFDYHVTLYYKEEQRKPTNMVNYDNLQIPRFDAQNYQNFSDRVVNMNTDQISPFWIRDDGIQQHVNQSAYQRTI